MRDKTIHAVTHLMIRAGRDLPLPRVIAMMSLAEDRMRERYGCPIDWEGKFEGAYQPALMMRRRDLCPEQLDELSEADVEILDEVHAFFATLSDHEAAKLVIQVRPLDPHMAAYYNDFVRVIENNA